MAKDIHPYSVLPFAVRQWALKHIKLVKSSAYDLAVELCDDGYRLHYNPDFVNALGRGDEKALYYAILHELLHVLRGDCLITLRDKNIDHEVWNYSADVNINMQLPYSLLDTYCKMFWGDESDGILTYEKMRVDFAEVEWPDDAVPSTRFIYDHIKPIWDKRGKRKSLNNDVVRYSGSNPRQAEKAHAGAVLDAAQAFKDTDLQDMASIRVKRGLSGTFSRRSVPALVTEIPDLLRWARNSAGGIQAKKRTWRRESHACPDLPGVGYVRRYKVAIAIDCSGSLANLYEKLIGVARWAAKDLDLEVILWASEAKHVRMHELLTPPDVGAWTYVKPALELARSLLPDALIVLTDGGFTDQPDVADLPSCPIIWGLCGYTCEDKIPKRPRDRIKKVAID
jgi:hypothetical protein